MSQIPQILNEITTLLLDYYGLPYQIDIKHFLLSKKNDVESAEHLENFRACTLVKQTSNDLEIGIYFSEPILNNLHQINLFKNLNEKNFDEFCVAVEEISHFILLIDRANKNRSTSKLE